MNNWRKIFSWNTSAGNLEVGEKVRVIATLEELDEFMEVWESITVSAEEGTVVKILPSSLSSEGYVAVKFTGIDFQDSAFEFLRRRSYIIVSFPSQNWQRFLERV